MKVAKSMIRLKKETKIKILFLLENLKYYFDVSYILMLLFLFWINPIKAKLNYIGTNVGF